MQKTYFKNLDATRAIAFFLVFCAHCFVSSNPDVLNSSLFQSIKGFGKLGFLGLEYFFVLSSFLITWIALEEHKNNNFFSLKKFIIRRSLRVWPLYFIIVITTYIVFQFLNDVFNYEIRELPNISNFIFFIVNFYTIENGTNYLFFLVFLWSISIEEQFYLIWSFVLKYFMEYIKVFSIILIVISIVFRWYFTEIEPIKNILYFHTFSAFGNFGIGSLIALMAFNQTKLFEIIKGLSFFTSIIIYCVLVLSVIFYSQIFCFSYLIIFERLFYSLIFGYIIIEQAFCCRPYFQLGRLKVLSFLGKISYGLYCYHGIVITLFVYALNAFSIAENKYATILIYPIFILIITIAVAAFSYKYLEKIFLKLKNKFY